MARKRLQFFLADLVAIIAVGALGLALVRIDRAARRRVWHFLIDRVGHRRLESASNEGARRLPAWNAGDDLSRQDRKLRLFTARNAVRLRLAWIGFEEVGPADRFSIGPGPPRACCDSRAITASGFGAVFPLLSPSGMAPALTIMVLLALSYALMLARFLGDSDQLKSVLCENCRCNIPPLSTTTPLFCGRCRRRPASREAVRQAASQGIWDLARPAADRWLHCRIHGAGL